MKKKFHIVLLLVLAVLLSGGGAMWYTRPQSFWEATGMDPEQITSASGYAIESSATDGVASQQSWVLDSLAPGQEDYEALLELLEGMTYRSSLQNLLPPPSFYTAANVIAWVSFAFGDDLVTVQADYPGKVWISSTGHGHNLVFSVSPRELNETLADFIQQRDTGDNP